MMTAKYDVCVKMTCVRTCQPDYMCMVGEAERLSIADVEPPLRKVYHAPRAHAPQFVKRWVMVPGMSWSSIPNVTEEPPM
ncbi:hypothetical protein TNCV_1922401 [Trichonephila clavipes]|nr:hypothetical protein TNCV_1922401 [Trichonephila clavipes]